MLSFQGVNLANIVKDVALRSEDGGVPAKHPSVEAIEALQELLKADSPNEDAIKSNLLKLKSECDIDLAHRCLAGKNNAYPVMYQLLDTYKSKPEMLEAVTSTFCALCNGQPDLLDIRGSLLLMKTLDAQQNSATNSTLLVHLIRLTCVMHESNRQGYINSGLIPILMNALESHKDKAELVKEVCFCLRVLTFDDDPRVPFGKAHEHAKMIVTEADALRKILNICQGESIVEAGKMNNNLHSHAFHFIGSFIFYAFHFMQCFLCIFFHQIIAQTQECWENCS